MGSRTPSRPPHFKRNLAREAERASDLKSGAPSSPRTHRYTTGMGASMSARRASQADGRGRRGRQAGGRTGSLAPAGPQVGPVSPPQPPFSRSRAPFGVRGFGEAGFRATKRKEEKTNRKSPESTQRRGNAGRAPGVGEMWGATEQDGGTQAAEALGPLRGKP